jgi:hypothetical protein
MLDGAFPNFRVEVLDDVYWSFRALAGGAAEFEATWHVNCYKSSAVRVLSAV